MKTTPKPNATKKSSGELVGPPPPPPPVGGVEDAAGTEVVAVVTILVRLVEDMIETVDATKMTVPMCRLIDRLIKQSILLRITRKFCRSEHDGPVDQKDESGVEGKLCCWLGVASSVSPPK